MSVEPLPHSKPIKDINDPHVQKIGKLAVEDHNKKRGDNLKFVRVVNGLLGRSSLPLVKDQIVYQLVVETETTNGINWTYEAKVLETIGGCLKWYIEFKSFEYVLPYKP